jgi:hypothetical protein
MFLIRFFGLALWLSLSSFALARTDGDGVPDNLDNCVSVAKPSKSVPTMTDQVMLVMMMALREPSMCSLMIRRKAWTLTPTALGTMRMEMTSQIMH